MGRRADYVDQRRLAPIGASAPTPIGADRRWPWPTRLAPTDADTTWQRPSATMLEPSKHAPPHTPFLCILLKLQTGWGFQRPTPVQV